MDHQLQEVRADHYAYKLDMLRHYTNIYNQINRQRLQAHVDVRAMAEFQHIVAARLVMLEASMTSMTGIMDRISALELDIIVSHMVSYKCFQVLESPFIHSMVLVTIVLDVIINNMCIDK
jgi:hypothetical protein